MNYTSDDMTSKLGLFSEKQMIALYLTESTKTDWLQMLDEQWEK